MSLLEQQNFLARVYTDENLRRAFLAEPAAIGAQNNLNEKEIAEIVEIFPDEINAFAESLFFKRLHEVEKLLPLTRAALAEDFAESFRAFAPTFNSQSTKKHLEDALRFGDFLQKREAVSAAKNAARYECARLEFYRLDKNFLVRRFDFDAPTGERKKHFRVWLRLGKREFVF